MALAAICRRRNILFVVSVVCCCGGEEGGGEGKVSQGGEGLRDNNPRKK